MDNEKRVIKNARETMSSHHSLLHLTSHIELNFTPIKKSFQKTERTFF